MTARARWTSWLGSRGRVGTRCTGFNAELDADTDSMGGRMQKMRTVRPGIEARIKLLFKFEGWDGVNWDGLDKVDM